MDSAIWIGVFVAVVLLVYVLYSNGLSSKSSSGSSSTGSSSSSDGSSSSSDGSSSSGSSSTGSNSTGSSSSSTKEYLATGCTNTPCSCPQCTNTPYSCPTLSPSSSVVSCTPSPAPLSSRYTYGIWKTGNNGSVTCDTFCQEPKWGGFSGWCVGGYDNKNKKYIGCPENVTDSSEGVSCFCNLVPPSNYYQETGNDGSVTCDRYCAGDQWGGTSGWCVGSINNTDGSRVACSTNPGKYTTDEYGYSTKSNVTCLCEKGIDPLDEKANATTSNTSFWMGGNNGTVTCSQFCAGKNYGSVQGMCVGGYDIVNKTYIGCNTNLSNTNVTNSNIYCYCSPEI